MSFHSLAYDRELASLAVRQRPEGTEFLTVDGKNIPFLRLVAPDLCSS